MNDDYLISKRDTSWKPGDYPRACDRCGRTYNMSEMKKEQHTGLVVCIPGHCYEDDHPQNNYDYDHPQWQPEDIAEPRPATKIVTQADLRKHRPW